VRGVSGCAILGDGRIGLILDAPGIIGPNSAGGRAA
jgi:chemotaxis protein histidine kinase CheA